MPEKDIIDHMFLTSWKVNGGGGGKKKNLSFLELCLARPSCGWSGPFLLRVGSGPSFLLWGFATPSWRGGLALLGVRVGTYFSLGLGEAVLLTVGLPLFFELALGLSFSG